MNDYFQALMNFTNAGGRYLLLWSWQIALLLGLVCLILRILRFRAATIRHQVWAVALLGVMILPPGSLLAHHYLSAREKPLAIDFLIELPANFLGRQGQAPAPLSPTGSPSVSYSFHQRDLYSLVFLAWATGLLFAARQVSGSYRQSGRTRRSARAVSLADLQCQDLLSHFQRAGRLEIKLADSLASPLLAGLLRPAILLPADIRQWTTVEERKTILLHEMIHAQRKDHWANYLQSMVRMVFFFHPLVGYAANQYSLEREFSCDERVLLFGVQASSYVESILKVAEKSIARDALHQPAFITRKMLERRIDMILKSENLHWSAKRWSLLALPVAVIAVTLWVLIPKGAAAVQPAQEASAIQDLRIQEDRQKRELEKGLVEKELKEKELLTGKIGITVVDKELQEHREVEMKAALQGAEILARVSELQVIYGKRHAPGEKSFEITADETTRIDEQTIHKNVLVKAPEMTLKAEHAEEQDGIIRLVGNPIEIEKDGRTYYSYNAIAVAQRGGMFIYVVSKHGKLFTEKNQLSERIDFDRLLRHSN
jgi:beta-lactamase regulating signal transducer with metallopeptidase domain